MNQQSDYKEIKSALVSVFNKAGIEPIVRKLHSNGVRLLSTGGSRSFIESLGIPCDAVEDLTGYPSILGGRVKTLHPKVFGGILARRDNEGDRAELEQYAIPAIDLVIVDLYPFEATIAKEGVTMADAVENIDIGGPSMLRSAAKNFNDVTVVCDPSDYAGIIEEIAANGNTLRETRLKLSAKAYTHTALYDSHIATYMRKAAGLDEKLFLAFDAIQTPVSYTHLRAHET